jgi:hypothetical protein
VLPLAGEPQTEGAQPVARARHDAEQLAARGALEPPQVLPLRVQLQARGQPALERRGAEEAESRSQAPAGQVGALRARRTREREDAAAARQRDLTARAGVRVLALLQRLLELSLRLRLALLLLLDQCLQARLTGLLLLLLPLLERREPHAV